MRGQTLSHYQVIEAIGAGGMGLVYRARDTQLNRDVALKVLPLTKDSDTKARGLLVREAQTASALNHPYVCVVYEVGEEQGHIFIAMEFVRGKTLALLLSHGPLPLSDVLRYGSQVAEALEHAHSKGVVHRDLKTTNVMVTADARVKMLDFGLAKRLSVNEMENTLSQSLVANGEIAGTLAYMAPEVLRGASADERLDIWALGVMLYEMCSGRRPFEGSSAYELSSAILRDDPPPLPKAAGAGLAEIIRRCLNKEPSQRYQFVAEVRAALEGVQIGRRVAVPKRMHWLVLSAGMIFLIGILIAAYFAFFGRASITSVALLPLRAGTADTEYLGDGITDTLIDNISRLPGVKVISHTSAFQYKGKEIDPRTIGNQLGVDAIMTGSVASRDGNLTVAVELVSTRDNTRLWGAQYARKLSDLATVQSDISKEISEQLRLHLSREQKHRLDGSSTENSEAYQFFLRGQYYLYKGTSEGNETARRYCEQAVESDPAFVLAYVCLGHYYLQMADEGSLTTQEAFPKAKALADKVLAMDPDLGPGHSIRGWVALFYDRNLSQAEMEFKRAMQLTPSWVEAYRGYSVYLRTSGRSDEAIAAYKHALELDPLSVAVSTSLGWTYYYCHRYAEAITQFQTSIAMDPGRAAALQGLAFAYMQNGMEKEGIEALESYVTSSGSPELASEIRRTYAKSGFRVAVRTFWQAALNINLESAKEGHTSPFAIAGLYSLLDDKENAFLWLDKAYVQRSPKLLDLRVDPDFENLRDDPRFKELVQRVGLP